jgi:hypothetical protein
MHRAVIVVILSLAAIASAETRKERNARVMAEWQKFENNAANVCGAGGVLYFNYSPLDLYTLVPVLFSPSLPHGLLKNAAAALGVKDEAVKATIAQAFDAALDERIEGLHDGTYNIINVLMKKGPSFAITPRENRGDDVLIWLYRGFSDRLLDVTGGGTPRDNVYVLSADGRLTPIDKSSRPKWLTSEDLFTQAGGNYRSERKRQAHYVKCE